MIFLDETRVIAFKTTIIFRIISSCYLVIFIQIIIPSSKVYSLLSIIIF